MKKLTFTLLFIVLALAMAFAQVPQAFKYQAVARDADGNIIANDDISMRVSIINDNPEGDIVYSEIHQVKTTALGLMSLNIGQGEFSATEFSQLDWASGNHYIQLEMDPAGGSNFIPMGISELLSVPYALHALSSGESTEKSSNKKLWKEDKKTGNIYNTNSGNVGIGTANADASAMLDVASTSKGMLIPRMTAAERDAIDNPATGLLVFVTDNNSFSFFNGTIWSGIVYGNTTDLWVREGTVLSPGTAGDFITTTGGMGIGTASTEPTAKLEVTSTDKGFLPPRMTEAQRNAISSPAFGLVILCSNCSYYGELQVFNNVKWTNMIGGAASHPWVGGEDFPDLRDDNVYSTVKLGDQIWMTENLNYDQNAYGNDWCYNDNSANCDTYGRLYDWAAVMQGASASNSNPSGVQGICPLGWHIPSRAEWKELFDYVSSQPGYLCNSNTEFIAKALAANTNWEASEDNCAIGNNLAANNSTGFSALPGGYRDFNGTFDVVGYSGHWWSSSQYSSGPAWNRSLYNSDNYVIEDYYGKQGGFSVRCVRD